MFKMNRMIMIAVVAMAFVAVAGVANAAQLDGLTIKADTVQTNGNYIGVPTQVTGELYHWGYNYTLVPDGTYTVFGTIVNEHYNDMTVTITMKDGSTTLNSAKIFVEKADSKPTTVDYSITIPAGMISSPNDISGTYTSSTVSGTGAVDFDDANYVDAPQGMHTINYGPMSDMVVIYTNGKLSSTTSLDFGLNQTSADINAYYTNGKFDFKNSPLYSFL